MDNARKITDLPEAAKIPEGSAYLVESGDGSGTKQVTHETLVSEVEKALPIGDMKELEELEKQGEQEEPSAKEKVTLVKAILKVLSVATSGFKGTDGIKAGIAGIVPAPKPEDKGKVLGAEGKWVEMEGGGSGGDTKAEDVKFKDGKTAEEKLGAIDGMTSDLNCENERIAASAAGLKKVNDSLNNIGTSVKLIAHAVAKTPKTVSVKLDGYKFISVFMHNPSSNSIFEMFTIPITLFKDKNRIFELSFYDGTFYKSSVKFLSDTSLLLDTTNSQILDLYVYGIN